MCTLIILRRPGHAWPVLIAANRDEMLDRPWLPPGPHWPDREGVIAGQDQLAGGTWLGTNAEGVAAGILNRPGALGPAEGKRSRGELVLEALDHGDAADAADALSHLDPRAYRPFNLVIADNHDAFWLRLEAGAAAVVRRTMPPGLLIVTSYDPNNDTACPRIARHLPRWRAAPPPRPDHDDWSTWQALLAEDTPEGAALTIRPRGGFGTVSSALIALPAAGCAAAEPHWLFAAGPPNRANYRPLPL